MCTTRRGFFFLWLSTDTEHTDASPMQKEGLDSLWKVVVFFVKEVAELPEGTGDAGNTECILLDRVGPSFFGGKGTFRGSSFLGGHVTMTQTDSFFFSW